MQTLLCQSLMPEHFTRDYCSNLINTQLPRTLLEITYKALLTVNTLSSDKQKKSTFIKGTPGTANIQPRLRFADIINTEEEWALQGRVRIYRCHERTIQSTLYIHRTKTVLCTGPKVFQYHPAHPSSLFHHSLVFIVVPYFHDISHNSLPLV